MSDSNEVFGLDDDAVEDLQGDGLATALVAGAGIGDFDVAIFRTWLVDGLGDDGFDPEGEDEDVVAVSDVEELSEDVHGQGLDDNDGVVLLCLLHDGVDVLELGVAIDFVGQVGQAKQFFLHGREFMTPYHDVVRHGCGCAFLYFKFCEFQAVGRS